MAVCTACFSEKGFLKVQVYGDVRSVRGEDEAKTGTDLLAEKSGMEVRRLTSLQRIAPERSRGRKAGTLGEVSPRF